VRDKVNTILARLPEGTDPPIIDKFDLDAMPVISLSVSAPRDLKEISYVTDKFINQNLETVPDVGSISMVGARTRAVQVSVQIEKLRAYNLTIDDLRRALERQNLEVPGGRLNQKPREVVVRTLGRMMLVKDFNELIVANVAGQPVYLKDVAKVEDSVEEPRTLSTANHQSCVTLVVRKPKSMRVRFEGRLRPGDRQAGTRPRPTPARARAAARADGLTSSCRSRRSGSR
jgi:HAE1 family hydrophobic/amphiphilic exporter-1